MIICVASGKGGTGKTLVATSLAVSLKNNTRVQLIDCDVEEPNDHIFVHPVVDESEAVTVPVPVINKNRCTGCGKCAEVCAFHALAVIAGRVLTFPELCHGCGACSYFCPEKAITEQEREIGVIESGIADGIAFVQGRLTVGEAMAPPVIRAVKKRMNPSRAVIIDAPPGTSCPVIETLKDSDFCLLVTEPTPFGLNDLKLAVETIKQLGVPSGALINRAASGNDMVREYCRTEDIPVLMTIPLDIEIARLYSRGVTLASGKPEWVEKFESLYQKCLEISIERNRCIKR